MSQEDFNALLVSEKEENVGTGEKISLVGEGELRCRSTRADAKNARVKSKVMLDRLYLTGVGQERKLVRRFLYCVKNALVLDFKFFSFLELVFN